MESREQREKEAEEAIDAINKKTGRNMPQAIGTAAVLIALIIACLLISIDLFVALIVVFMVLALWELRVDFATAGLHIPVIMLWCCSAATLVATYLAPHHIVAMAMGITASAVLVAVAASAKMSVGNRLSTAVAASAKMSVGNRLSTAVAAKLAHTDAGARLESSFNHEGGEQHHSRLGHVAVSLFTVLYIPLLGSCLIIPLTFNGHPVAHAIMLVFLPALSDTGGLFAGAWLGRHKLSPRISPKKSVEGLIGSMLFAMAGAFAVFACTYDSSLWTTRWWVPVAAGIMIGVVGTFGDLCASMLKRDIGIKDMGHLLKGHGGVMDRIDSILLSAPFTCLLLWATGL
ncbi:phosphatidate cytidylyltransferase [Bifidobacterium sp. 82T10]|uniref:Phosphatidate cytidylyltransferase n=1 Tax=Bifidobacterium miconis TaxID=2834435 RepID=A0ABS6WGG6_9BIFI|nr:phosphatidate cytidylyltransferase [Bifidobacterium miconis]MBW3092830.1 phosphatidate cytidylyltransferase [Bifidobacterium miconis]